MAHSPANERGYQVVRPNYLTLPLVCSCGYTVMTHKELLHYRWSFLCLFPVYFVAFIIAVEAWRVLLVFMIVHVMLGR